MRTIVWGLFFLTLAAWTGITALSVHIVDWVVQNAGNAFQNDPVAALNATALPSWLALWVDPAWLESIQGGLVATIEGAHQIMPWVASAMDWLSPLLWTLWALGALILLIITVVGHRLLGSFATANRT
ncbi:hypothetical protein C662_15998 [Thauera sp. 28]|uniref:hypothetical protein n=1 Tax=unclassified Thauera TaxID=2609274 RepID=UPI0002D050DB|nr:hypothetical protein [Thauera sp. 28]ENO91586.1 hypothetical protein C662_15998 [Thauera sp. 28]